MGNTHLKIPQIHAIAIINSSNCHTGKSHSSEATTPWEFISGDWYNTAINSRVCRTLKNM